MFLPGDRYARFIRINRPAGHDSGFLWRMNAYWRLEEADGGVYAECVSVTLSRGVPTGLGWLINPFVRDMPRESLEATLEATRTAVSGVQTP